MTLDFPAIYILKTGFESDPKELHRLEVELDVVFNPSEAEVFVGKVERAGRARIELHRLGLSTEPVQGTSFLFDGGRPDVEPAQKRSKLDTVEVKGNEVISLDSDEEPEDEDQRTGDMERLLPIGKRRRSNNPAAAARIRTSLDSSTGSGADSVGQTNKHPTTSRKDHIQQALPKASSRFVTPERMGTDTIKVLKLAWCKDSAKAGKLLPMSSKYLVYEGKVLHTPTKTGVSRTILPSKAKKAHIISSAKADSSSPETHKYHNYQKQWKADVRHSQPSSQPIPLLHETTEEHEVYISLPSLPRWMRSNYSCQRVTPQHSPNEPFLSQLRMIKKAYTILGDDNRIRAYMAAIAVLAAYPYSFTSVQEISNLPFCGESITSKWQQYIRTGRVEKAVEFANDERMKVLTLFHGIHGVGPGFARKFYDLGWRTLEDVVEFGWATLNREQQAGLKYYDELQLKIPRDEVENIANTVLKYANRLIPGFKMVVCGGYRRGKEESSDVDIVLSNPDERATQSFLEPLWQSLGEDEYITQVLTESEKNSEREQSPLPWKGSSDKRAGSGFDTLDHVFVVWQNPTGTVGELGIPNPHRRVDIIVSPWKTAGVAVASWSGGTMFQRDLRRYCKYELGWKFDSSGVRKRGNGQWVDLEKGGVEMVEKEKMVFQGLGLEWREPEERSTD